jgi:hypothetical protein
VLKFWVWPVLGLDAQNTATYIASAITKIIERDRTFGWEHDRDLQNHIRNAILDFFFVQVLTPGAINLGPDVIDMIADDVPASARVRMANDRRIRWAYRPLARDGVAIFRDALGARRTPRIVVSADWSVAAHVPKEATEARSRLSQCAPEKPLYRGWKAQTRENAR